MKEYLLARLREPSTWRGIAMLLGAAGVLTSEQAEQLQSIAAAMVASGLIGALAPEGE